MDASERAGTVEEWIVREASRSVAAREQASQGRLSPGPVRRWAARHWLALLNTMNGVIALGTVLAPWLRAQGHELVAGWLYSFYRLQCPQRPSHSFRLWGELMGMEQRMVAMYAGAFVGGLAYGLLRSRLRPLPTVVFGMLSLPMAADLLTQMTGLRDGTGWMRVLSGVVFAIAAVAWSLPRVNTGMIKYLSRPVTPATMT